MTDDFEVNDALAELLRADEILLNSHWDKVKDIARDPVTQELRFVPLPDARWTAEEARTIAVGVICNDVFAWGCADAEELPYSEIIPLWRAWKADKVWGTAKWCCRQRGVKPQQPVIRRMKEAGVWDEAMEALPDQEVFRPAGSKSAMERALEAANGSSP